MKALKKATDALGLELTAHTGRARNLARYVTGRLKTPEVGQSPHDVILQMGRTRLLAYTPVKAPTHRVPMLFVPSLVNRHYILDLIPERSVVSYLQHLGFKCYMLDWGVPGLGDRRLSLDEYIGERLDLAVRTVTERTGTAPTLVGYCMGGSLAMVYAALYPERVRNLVLLATPVDFEQAGLLRTWSAPGHFNLEQFIDANGLVPPDVLNQAFTLLKPSWQFNNLRSLWQFGWNDDFLRGFMAISKWVNDPVPVAGEAFRQYVQDYYRDNGIVAGTLRHAGRKVDFGRVQAPVLNIIAAKDHIVPPASSQALDSVLSGTPDVTSRTLPVGHIGLSVGAGAFSTVWKEIATWLAERSA